MERRTSSSVELRDLTESRSLRDLTVLHLSSTTSRVQDVALVADIEDITSVGPDTVIVLTDQVAVGGWMISAALRYVWEQRACALIVPESSITSTAIELARRLDVSLLAARRDPTRLALEVALQIGVARAGSVARIQAFTDRLARTSALPEAMTLVSRELGGAKVRFESSSELAFDVVAPAAGERRGPDGRSLAPVTVPLARGDGAADVIIVQVMDHERDYAEQLLRASVPTFRALLSESRLEAIRDSLPAITLTTLTGWSRTGMLEHPTDDDAASPLHWPITGSYVAICVLAEQRERIGAVLHQLWQRDFPKVPLAPIADGWLAFAPAANGKAAARLAAGLRQRLAEAHGLGIKVGVSRRYKRADDTVAVVREAWLAARLADDSDAVVVFGEIPSRLLGKLMPLDLAEKLAAVLLPRLIADPASEEIVEAVVTYLAARGSVSRAAELLGVHRNTMQARIRRAEELGVALADPDAVLPMHLLLGALARRFPGDEPSI